MYLGSTSTYNRLQTDADYTTAMIINTRVFTFHSGSPWRDRISLAILELQEKGSIHLLYNKWWKDTGDVCNRDDKNKESKASALGVENIGRFMFTTTLLFLFLLLNVIATCC